MIDVLLASASSLATSPAELTVLVACIVLLSLRAWSDVTDVALTRRVSQTLTYVTLLLVLLFVVLAVVRFRTLG